jgi:hypothetical protein
LQFSIFNLQWFEPMAVIQSEKFNQLAATALDTLSGPRPGAAEAVARMALWRSQEFHNWFRWRVCKGGFDWSKPAVIGLLILGFGALIVYGSVTGKWFVTAGGVVLWFTAVNLSFFTYFGLQLPAPPRPMPGPFQPGQFVRAEMGLYPAGYERRKLARILLRIKAPDEPAWVIELAMKNLDAELSDILSRQSLPRMHGGDAPLMNAIVETLPVTREQIDGGEAPVKVVAWKWDEQQIQPMFPPPNPQSAIRNPQ